MAKFLCGSKEFGIVTCLNMISCYFHVNFMPHLKRVLLSLIQVIVKEYA